MRYWAVVALVLAAFLVQTTVGSYLAVAGVAPDVLLVLTVSFGLLYGWQVGGGVGLAGGLLLDLAFGRYIGLHGLALGLTGLLAGLVEASVVKDNPFLPFMGGVLGNLITRIALLGTLLLLGRPVLSNFRTDLLVSTIYNAVLCTVVYPWFYRHYNDLHPNPRVKATDDRA